MLFRFLNWHHPAARAWYPPAAKLHTQQHLLHGAGHQLEELATKCDSAGWLDNTSEQFYFGISRLTSRKVLKILATDERGALEMETRNIIFQELLGYFKKFRVLMLSNILPPIPKYKMF